MDTEWRGEVSGRVGIRCKELERDHKCADAWSLQRDDRDGAGDALD